MITIHGGNISPFVRKAHVFCQEKGIPFRANDLSPIPKSPELLAMHPLGKIPVLEDDGDFIPDSSVICAYLERRHPKPTLYPEDPKAFARALFFEEWADSKGVEVFSPALFECVIKKIFFKQEPDQERLAAVRKDVVPPALDWLESQIGDGEGLVDGRFSVADCAVGAQLQNWTLAGEQIDAARWPKLARYSEATLSRPSFKGLTESIRAAAGA
jgi:glutathione S-transferase